VNSLLCFLDRAQHLTGYNGIAWLCSAINKHSTHRCSNVEDRARNEQFRHTIAFRDTVANTDMPQAEPRSI